MGGITWGYVLRRVGMWLLTILIGTTLIFMIPRLAPGDPVAAMIGRPGLQVITAAVPLAEMVGYATALRSSSRGRATYAMQFKHYAEAPAATRDRLAQRSSRAGA